MIPDLEQIVRLLSAAALGAIIGFERERRDRAAGLRTHALVSTASALIMVVSAYGFMGVVTTSHTIVLDPSRIAAQVVSGIGFLGAGTIILRKNTVHGLTTAASIWLVAGLGLACGAGLYVAAGSTTVIALGILRGLKLVEQRVFDHKRVAVVRLYARRQPGQLAAIEDDVRAAGMELRQVQVNPGRTTDDSAITVEVRGGAARAVATLVERLRERPDVLLVSYGRREMAGQDTDPDESADASA